VVATVRKDEKEAYSIDGEVTEKATEGGLIAPITAGEKIGTAWLKNTNDGSTIATVDIVAENSMEPREEEQGALGVISDIIDDGVEPISVLFWVIGIAVFVAVVIAVIAVVRAAMNSRKRRRNRMYGVKLKDSVDPREIRRIKSINHRGWGGK
jgi:hypothetical protein